MNLAQYAKRTNTTPAAFRRLLAEQGVEVSHQAVMLWFQNRRQPAATKMDAIEAATGGLVTRYHQRPDVFGRTPRKAA